MIAVTAINQMISMTATSAAVSLVKVTFTAACTFLAIYSNVLFDKVDFDMRQV